MAKLRSRSRDLNDTVERGVWGALTHLDGAGAVMSVRGTGTLDEELPVVNVGYGFNLPQDSNAEIVMVSLGSDVNDKVALPQIPRDKQHKWEEGQGGIQHPTDPERRIEFNDDATWLKDGNYRFGVDGESEMTIEDGAVTIKTSSVTIEASDVTMSGNLEVKGRITTGGSVNVGGSLSVDGGISHQGTGIGKGHRHSGVDRGDDTSGPVA